MDAGDNKVPERKKTAGDNGGGDDVEARRFLIKGGTREGESCLAFESVKCQQTL